MTYYIQTSLTGLAIVLIIWLNFRGRRRGRQLTAALFALLLAADTLLLIVELALNGLSGRAAATTTAVAGIAALFYMLNPVPAALWVLYVYALVIRRERLPRAVVAVVAVPALLFAGLALASVAGSYAFLVDAASIYHRGRYFPVMVLLCYGYLAVAVVLVLWRRAALRRRELVSLLIFPLLPLVAGTLQFLFFGVSLLWLSVALALLIVYLDVQKAELNTDYLTGLVNRRGLDAYLDSLVVGSRRSRAIGGIMIDVDDFKRINDVHGHDVGDRVLETVANLLRRCLSRRELIARFAGDEFAAVLLVRDEAELAATVAGIEAAVAEVNVQRRYPFELSLSMGSVLQGRAAPFVPAEFVKLLDEKMYEAKRARRKDEQGGGSRSCSPALEMTIAR